MLVVATLPSGKQIIGVQIGNDHARRITLKEPLAWRYVQLNNELELEFDYWDKYSMPHEIRVAPEVVYKASDKQTRKYENAAKKLFEEI